MDLYLCDYRYYRDKLIDNYNSLIVTERYSEHSELTLNIKFDRFITYGMRSSHWLMFGNTPYIIESINADPPAGKDSKITVKCVAATKFLELRSSKLGIYANGKVVDDEKFSGLPGDIARWIVSKYCINPTSAGTVNVIPGLTAFNFVPGESAINISMKRDTVYSMVKNICDSYKYGFRMYSSAQEPGKLTFAVYTGLDYTGKAAGDFSPMYRLFSQDLGNIEEVSFLETSNKYRNHARVIGKHGGTDVYAPNTPSSVSGFERRTIVIDASDIDTNNFAEELPYLIQRGKQALASKENQTTYLLDGKVPIDLHWNDYHVDLGDKVWVKDSSAGARKAMVTEMITSIDETGLIRYPTFSEI